jgi:subtilisin family serine protease
MVAINDPLFAQQWHLKMLGNINRIWDEYTGANVHIGVFDDGVQFTHADLDANYDTSRQFVYNGIAYSGAPLNLTGNAADSHGTAVAGIIASEANNGIGGVGVAYGASITCVPILSDNGLWDNVPNSAVLGCAANFDIMSNSWGYLAAFKPFQNLSDPNSFESQIASVYANVTQTGRGGLGTVIVQSAGNDGTSTAGDGILNLNEVISVAALTAQGGVQDYSNFGANVFISAGAASVTTDLMGSNGYSSGAYATDFGGTSAAAPVVTGVVALMLSANPNLGWRDVKEILATSAKMTGSIAGGSRDFETTGTWFQVNRDNGDTWNDGGRAFSNDYGFGQVDAFAAVRLAEVWSLMNGPAKTSANETVISASNFTTQQIAYSSIGGYAHSTVNVTQHLTVEYVSVTLDMLVYAAGGLPLSSLDSINMTLHGPDGTYFVLTEKPTALPSDLANGMTWTFGVSHALGKDAFGAWTLRLGDLSFPYQQHGGAISGVTIEFHGSAWDTSNIHHITQDFLLAHSVNTGDSRDRVINDVNGGTDWLEMATLAADLIVFLVPGRAFSVGGVAWGSIGASTVIENITAGDGNDRIGGNAGANFIYGMRGNDTINGGLGNDKLDGGADNDLLQGAIGNDQLIGGFGHDTLIAGEGNDLLVGGVGLDMLIGEDGNDQLLGVGGNDNLNGGAGNDRLEGGAGRDTLTAGAGNDSFVFTRGSGGDFIMDFEDNLDTLVLSKGLWGGSNLSASAVLSSFATFSVGHVVLNFGGGDTITITGLTSVSALLDDLLLI